MIWTKKLPACLASTGTHCLRAIFLSNNRPDLLTYEPALRDNSPSDLVAFPEALVSRFFAAADDAWGG